VNSFKKSKRQKTNGFNSGKEEREEQKLV
jgi:hypothetical protein